MQTCSWTATKFVSECWSLWRCTADGGDCQSGRKARVYSEALQHKVALMLKLQVDIAAAAGVAGCYADDMELRPTGVVDLTAVPPINPPQQTISRRMFRRLGQLPTMVR
jgi:hypothetical protein